MTESSGTAGQAPVATNHPDPSGRERTDRRLGSISAVTVVAFVLLIQTAE